MNASGNVYLLDYSVVAPSCSSYSPANILQFIYRDGRSFKTHLLTTQKSVVSIHMEHLSIIPITFSTNVERFLPLYSNDHCYIVMLPFFVHEFPYSTITRQNVDNRTFRIIFHGTAIIYPDTNE